MRVTIRAFVYGATEPIFTETEDNAEQNDSVLKCEALQRHEAELKARPHMIEIEFPPERPNGQKTYFRFGNEPRLMKIPVPLHTMTRTDRARFNPLNN